MPFRARTYIGSLGDVVAVELDAPGIRRREADRH